MPRERVGARQRRQTQSRMCVTKDVIPASPGEVVPADEWFRIFCCSLCSLLLKSVDATLTKEARYPCRATAKPPMSKIPFLLALAGVFMLCDTNLRATVLYWSGGGSVVGGAGTWDTTNVRWGTSTAGPFTTVWNN